MNHEIARVEPVIRVTAQIKIDSVLIEELIRENEDMSDMLKMFRTSEDVPASTVSMRVTFGDMNYGSGFSMDAFVSLQADQEESMVREALAAAGAIAKEELRACAPAVKQAYLRAIANKKR